MLDAFGLSGSSQVILSGTDKDPPIEGWWRLGRQRRDVIRRLRDIGITLVTTPNYSLFTDQPRWDDLHAMKRIALVHEEFLSEGLPAALHVNARTDTDMQRWTDYIAGRSEITHVAYEFATGPGRSSRQEAHVAWLAGMARSVGRPLHLVVRGGLDALPTLVNAFTRVSVIETSIFIRTIKRRRAVLSAGGTLTWETALTPVGMPLDDLLAYNYRTMECWIRASIEPAVREKRAAPR
jgi:hypothetical protein